jgi:two-component system KDP operon response regulator KdpE
MTCKYGLDASSWRPTRRLHQREEEVDLPDRPINRVGLTPTEWQLLEILVRNSGRLVSQRQLLREVWGPSYETESNYLRVYLAQLRRKLEPEPSRPRYLLTEPGMGYRFKP